MIKRMDKRGAMAGDTIVYLLIALAVLGIVLLFFTGGFGPITNLFEKIFGGLDIEPISQRCEYLASIGSAGFCTDRIEIKSNKYINCPYAISKLGAKIESNEPSDCPKNYNDMGTINDAFAKQICEFIKIEKDEKFQPEKTTVNGQTCIALGVPKTPAQ